MRLSREDAYEDALQLLQLPEKAIPARELLAAKIAEIASGGERDKGSLCDRAIPAAKAGTEVDMNSVSAAALTAACIIRTKTSRMADPCGL
jgi:hypothetical protein